MKTIASIILAAGRARRFGVGPGDSKVLAQLSGKALVRHVAEAAIGSQARPIYVVTGQAADRVEAALDGLDLGFIRNPNPDAGLSQSLTVALRALPEEVSGAIVLLADMPFVKATLINGLIAAFNAASKEPQAVVPVRAGRYGNPVLLGRSIFARAQAISGDRGARSLLEAPDVDVLDYPVDDEAIEIDIDTREMLDRVEAGDFGKRSNF
jgi:molybdenum cofactor cytidylyltransferase